MKHSSSRLTVDMSAQEHMCLKMASASLGVSMREFILIAAFEKMEELEDKWLIQKARETLKRIESGEEKVRDFNKVKKRVL